MRRFRVRVDDEVFEVEVEEVGQGVSREPAVSAPRPSAPAPVNIPAKKAAPVNPTPPSPAPSAKSAAGGAGAVTAPIPGVVNEIKVSAGKSVKKGEVLLLLEAMKMQNEILAPYDATVAEICVSQGASVQTGDVLVKLDK